jgi:hypothetical protein
MRLVLGSLLHNSVTDYGRSRLTIVNRSSDFLLFLFPFMCEVQYEAGDGHIGQSSTY